MRRKRPNLQKTPNSLNSYLAQFLRTTSQPALKIGGTLSRPSVTGEALVSASLKPTPQQVGSCADETNTAVAAAPLPVFEDRGTLASTADTSREAGHAPKLSALVPGAPQRAAQDSAQNGVAASVPQQLAQAGVAPATNIPGGLPPLSRLHEEVAAFAAAAWPTRVSLKKLIFSLCFFSSLSASSTPDPSHLFPRFSLFHRFQPVFFISVNPKSLSERGECDQQLPNGRLHYRDAPLAAVTHCAVRLAGHRAQPTGRRPRYSHPGGVSRDDEPSPGLYEVNRRLEFLGPGKLPGCFPSSARRGKETSTEVDDSFPPPRPSFHSLFSLSSHSKIT